MATLQMQLDDELRRQAQAVAASMGLDLASAVRVFLTQMVRVQGLPFQPMADDPFYSTANQQALRNSLAQLDAGQGVVKTMAELESMAE